jgi:hypothetical protein
MGTRIALSLILSIELGECFIMVAFNRVRCTVIAVSQLDNACLSRGALAREVLPWADPYVAQLIEKLQNEVREERRLQSRVRHYRTNGSEVNAA